MNKKLLALAVAAALAPAAAMADSGNVTVYGIMDASYDITDNGNSTAGAQGIRTNKVSSNSSRLGFKGSEDLGNGTSAVWQIETGINADGTAAADLNSRNTFVGLSNKTAGTVILGKHDTPYKLATRNLDVFGDGIADNRAIMGGGAGLATPITVNTGGTSLTTGNTLAGYGSAVASFDGRQKDVVAYISPSMSGFSAVVAYVAGAEGASTSGQSKGSAWSLAGLYDNGPFFASLAYEKHSFGNASGDLNGTAIAVTTGTGGTALATVDAKDREESAWKLGLGYKTDVFRVGLAYEKTSDDLGDATVSCTTITGVAPYGCTAGKLGSNSDLLGHHAWYLGGGYKINANNELKLAYTKAGDQGNTSNTGATQWTVGVDHMMSKRTKVYALYTKLNNDNSAAYNLGQGTGIVNPKGAGADPSAWSFGMRHTF